MKKQAFVVVTAMIMAITGISFMGCPPITPAPNPSNLLCWSVWNTDEGGQTRQHLMQVFNLEELQVVAGDNAVNLDFAGGDPVTIKIGYKLTGITDLTYVTLLPDTGTSNKSAEVKFGEYYGYGPYGAAPYGPYGIWYANAWYPNGFWYCNSVDVDFLLQIVGLVTDNLPAVKPAITTNGEFSITVPFGQTVESAVLNVETSNGSFILTIRNAPVETTKFTLTTLVEGQGTVTGAGPYDSGATATIVATAATGWHFDHWMVGTVRGISDPSAQVTVNGDMTVTAVFIQNAVTQKAVLTTSVVGQGTTQPSGSSSYDAGTVVTVSATAASGWHFVNWTVNGVTGNSNPGTVAMNGDVALVAIFAQDAVQQFTVSVTIDPVGGGIVSGAGTYPAGTMVTLTASPTAGWHFDHWGSNSVPVRFNISNVNPIPITMTSDMSVTAFFVQDVTPPPPTDNRGKLIVDLTAAGGIVSFKINTNGTDGYTAATFGGIGDQSQIQSMGLQIFYTAAVNGLWTDRQTFAFSGTWPVTGVLTKVNGKTLRFEVVANAAGAWGDPLKLVVKLNGVLVPRVADQSGTAYQVTLP